jgi:hypothetical protein
MKGSGQGKRLSVESSPRVSVSWSLTVQPVKSTGPQALLVRWLVDGDLRMDQGRDEHDGESARKPGQTW